MKFTGVKGYVLSTGKESYSWCDCLSLEGNELKDDDGAALVYGYDGHVFGESGLALTPDEKRWRKWGGL